MEKKEMKRSIRLIIAVLLTGLLVLTAVSVWAAPKFQGTVVEPPPTGGGPCSEGTINMGTALFTPLGTDCTIFVEWIEHPATTYVPAPAGLTFVGDTFKVTMNPVTELFEVCYAYPPNFADRNARIYRLNEEAKPTVWVEVPGAKIDKVNMTICVTSISGVISLIGNP